MFTVWTFVVIAVALFVMLVFGTMLGNTDTDDVIGMSIGVILLGFAVVLTPLFLYTSIDWSSFAGLSAYDNHPPTEAQSRPLEEYVVYRVVGRISLGGEEVVYTCKEAGEDDRQGEQAEADISGCADKPRAYRGLLLHPDVTRFEKREDGKFYTPQDTPVGGE